MIQRDIAMRLSPLLYLFCTVSSFAGQSLVLTPGVRPGAIDPNLATQQAWRVEFQLHSWVPPTTNTNDAFLWDYNGIGANAAIVSANELRISNKRDSLDGGCDLSLIGRTNVVVRLQRDPVQKKFTCELWNADGTDYIRATPNIVSVNPWAFSNGVFGSAFTTAQLGFFRIYLTLVQSGGRPPVTAEQGDWTNLTFDNTANDSSGHGHNVVGSGLTFQDTPDQGPKSFPKTDGAPLWSDWISLRAGYPAVLDGTRSFSLADQSSAVSYFWQQTSGPSTLIWSDRTAAQPTVKGLVFGTYTFRLTVTD